MTFIYTWAHLLTSFSAMPLATLLAVSNQEDFFFFLNSSKRVREKQRGKIKENQWDWQFWTSPSGQWKVLSRNTDTWVSTSLILLFKAWFLGCSKGTQWPTWWDASGLMGSVKHPQPFGVDSAACKSGGTKRGIQLLESKIPRLS